MKILIAEDDMASRLLLGATLRKLGHEVTVTSDGQEAWDAMDQEAFPLVISDWMMPHVNGIQLCERIRARALGTSMQYTYIILLTARSGKGSYMDGMNSGADDFITKPFDEDQLAARLRVAERILSLHETLRTQAMYDALTGLMNRGAITERLCYELERGAREGKELSVVLLDLDHFKSVNDTFGHATGDTVLKEAAQRMKKAMRGYDTVGRYGGEEFLVVAPGCAKEDSLMLGERLRHCLGDLPIQTFKGPLRLTSSLGVAAASAPGENAESMISRADDALYLAKSRGRNRCELAGAAATSNPAN